MTFKKIFPIVICSALLAGASVVAIRHGANRPVKKANASTDIGEVTIGEVRNAISNASAIYLLPTAESGLPDSWSYAYAGVGESDGVFINGVKQGGAVLMHAGTGSAFTTFYYGLPNPAVAGDQVEFTGTFATESAGGYTFSIHYITQWDGSVWTYALEDYDVISLKDANMPDFDSVAINTEDAGGYGYIGYDESGYAKKFAPKNKGLFGLTNETGSYSFQFNFEADGKMTSWLTVRIGASGGWTTGHYLKFNFTNIWHEDGIVVVSENEGDGDYASHKVEVRTDISSGQRLLEMGAIKVKGYTNKYYVFCNNNGVTSFGQYWDLADGTMSTKVGMYCPDTNVTVSNSLEPAAAKITLSDDSTGTALYFHTETNVLPFIQGWGEFFIPQDDATFTYNGVDASNNKWNYFKKVGATHNALFLGFGDLGVTPAADDVFHIGGVFKLARYVGTDNITVLYKIVIADCDFVYDGSAWHQVYTTVDFAKDLLKQTLTVCTGEGGDNGTVLAGIWSTLSGASYYGKLSSDDKNDLAIAVADSTIVVPLTSAGVDAMTDGDALGAAMYRYDYCTTKYSLTPFIVGRVISLANPTIRTINNTANIYVIIAVASSITLVTVSLFVVYRVLRKRKETR